MKKVYVIKAKDEDELVRKVNGFNKEIFATQPIQKIDGSWIAFVYCNEVNAKVIIPQIKEESATDKQIYFLESEGIAIQKGLTKTQAFNLIKEIKENGN